MPGSEDVTEEETADASGETVRGDYGLTGVQFRPDGKFLVTEKRHMGLWQEYGPRHEASVIYQVWDAKSGREVLALRGYHLVFSPNGTWVACWSFDGSVSFWDTRNGEQVFALPPPIEFRSQTWALTFATPDPVTFSPASSLLVSVSPDRTVALWDLDLGRMAQTLHVQLQNVLSFSPDGQRLATLAADGTIRLWDVVTGSEVLSLAVERLDSAGSYGATLTKSRLPSWVRFSPDGKQLACEGPTGVLFWDATPVEARQEQSAIGPR
jgi:WD40 repeat protein